MEFTFPVNSNEKVFSAASNVYLTKFLFNFTMNSVTSKEWIVLFQFQAVGCIVFVFCCCVTGSRLAFLFCLCAFKCYFNPCFFFRHFSIPI